ncbi:MAG TPA: DUF3105 domain-containing protein [Dehalococcoidia bacterium]|nr:DUF3105 domain-containing protein [Dehalococcoidia bacterium]
MNRQQQRQNARDQKRLQQRQRARQQGGRAAPPSLAGRAPAKTRTAAVPIALSPRRRWPSWLPFAIAGVVVVLLVVLFFLLDPLGLRAPLPGTKVASQGNAHVNPGDFHVAYSTDPPTSGPHFPTVPQPQIYKDPLATEFLPHFLEHAGVEVLYNKNAPADVVAKLKEIYRQEVDKTNVGVGPHLLLAPRPDMPCEVTVTAWQRITAWGSGCNQPGAVGHDFSLNGSADIDKLKTFIERNYCQYDPENTCGNGAKGGPINNNPVTPAPGQATVQALLGTATPAAGATPAASPTAPVGPLAPATPAASPTQPLGPLAPPTTSP